MSLAYYIAALITLVAAGYKTRDLRRDPASPTLRSFAATLYALGAAFLILANASRPVIDDLIGIEKAARWLGNSCTLVSAFNLQILLAHFTRRPNTPAPRIWLRGSLLLAAITAMGILIFGSPNPDHDDFVTQHADDPAITGYLLIYLGYLGVAMADALQLSWRYARHTAARYLCLGLRLVATGSATGLLYVAYKTAFAVARLTEVAPTVGTEGIVGPALGILASFQVVIGSTIGTWGPGVQERIQAWRSYRRLAPLWTALHEAFPEIALEAGQDVATRQYRRVIEIGDGQLKLRPYQNPASADRAAELASAASLTGQELRATVQAAVLAAALSAKRAGHPPNPDAPEIDTHITSASRTDLDDETAWLEQVAQAFAHSPIVRQVTADLRNDPATRTGE